jgi:hypothetical protein
MADKGFNGSSSIVTFDGSDVDPLNSVDVEFSVGEADVGGAADTTEIVQPGIPIDKTVTVEIVGSTDIVKGDTGALVISWNDGKSFGSLTNAIVSKITESGDEDGPITTSITFKPTPT